MRYSLLLPLIFLGLAGCVVDRTSPAPTTTTYVTPYRQPTYVSPCPPRHNDCEPDAVRAQEKPRHSGVTLELIAPDWARRGASR